MCDFRLLTANDIECRVARSGLTKSGKAWCSLLLYKTARVDRAILNETCGKFGWQNSYELIDGKLFCKLSIKDPQTGEWITRMDVGTQSNTEPEKGEASDALKRAGFAWGIGEELYTAPKDMNIWLEEGEYDQKGDKIYPKATFSVGDIHIDPATRKITYVSIIDNNGVQRFPKKGQKPQQVSKPTPAPAPAPAPTPTPIAPAVPAKPRLTAAQIKTIAKRIVVNGEDEFKLRAGIVANFSFPQEDDIALQVAIKKIETGGNGD